jgi:hypothetical protein
LERNAVHWITFQSGGKAPIDPLAEWARLHQRIAKTYIGYKSREKLNQYAIEFADRKKVTVAIAVLTCFSVR